MKRILHKLRLCWRLLVARQYFVAIENKRGCFTEQHDISVWAAKGVVENLRNEIDLAYAQDDAVNEVVIIVNQQK